jgi:segregation and condensation protein B
MAIEAQRAIEAILMVADAPVEPGLLAQLLEVTPARIEEICAELSRAYDDADRGFVLVRVAGGYRFQSHPDLAPYVERFVLEGQSARLSAAALETLAIVAYKQPVSRAQIASIRGVNADGVLRTLEQRGYITEVARDPGPGQALLYGTTSFLLERLGLDRVEDLPALADFVPGPEIMEALEHSLRFEREPARAPADASGEDGPDAAGEEAGGYEPEAHGAGDAGTAAEGAEHDARERLDAENAPGSDERGIDDFRPEDFHSDDFRAADARADNGATDPRADNGAAVARAGDRGPDAGDDAEENDDDGPDEARPAPPVW